MTRSIGNLMNILLGLAAFILGIFVPFQAIMNSRMSVLSGSNLFATFISFSGGFLIISLVFLFSGHSLPAISKIESIPPYLWLGGLVGCIFVLSANLLIPKIGSTAFIGLVVAGQIFISLIWDHFGLMGLPHNPISLIRLFGAAMLVSGALIVLYT